MKKLTKVLMSLLLVVSLIAGTCVVSVDAASGYSFKYGGVSVTIGSSATKFLKKAGKPVKKTEKKSCAYAGKDRTYQYKNFTVTTYSKSDKGTEYINSITLTTSKVSTKEGIKIGSKEKDVKKKYKKAKENFGVYTATKGKSKLLITVNKGKVTAIKYVAK